MLELKFLETGTEYIDTYNELQKSGIKKISTAKSRNWSGRINSNLDHVIENTP